MIGQKIFNFSYIKFIHIYKLNIQNIIYFIPSLFLLISLQSLNKMRDKRYIYTQQQL